MTHRQRREPSSRLRKNGSPPMTSRHRRHVAAGREGRSISASVPAFSTNSSSPSARAASCASAGWRADRGMFGLNSRPTVRALGTIWLQQPKSLCCQVGVEEAHSRYVAAGPLELVDQAKPRPGRCRSRTRSGSSWSRFLAAMRRIDAARRDDHGHPPPHEIGRHGRQAVGADLRPSDIRSSRFGPRQSRPPSDPVGIRPERAHRSGDSPCRNPITGIAGCCARAASGHAAAPPSSVMNSRRLMRSLLAEQLQDRGDSCGLSLTSLEGRCNTGRYPALGHSRRFWPNLERVCYYPRSSCTKADMAAMFGNDAAIACFPRASAHSITSSARASTVGGTSRPIALAVLRLITSSYLVGA